MKIGFVIASVSRRAGGLFESVRRLAQSVNDRTQGIAVFSSDDEFTRKDLPAWQPLRPQTFPVVGPWQFGYSPGLGRTLRGLEVDVLNTHGIWMYPSLACLGWARRHAKPLVIHAHGMLDPWAVNHHRWKKVLAGWAYENPHLRRASCLRALCASEAKAIRQYGLKNPVCVIPNGIDMPAAPSPVPPPWQGRFAPGRKVLLYIGRIHPKKGLPHLLRAWADLKRQNPEQVAGWAAAVAGWDQGGHEAELRAMARELGVADDVALLGPRFEEDKAACLTHADAFVLPSFSEGLPMAVLEAWAYGLPVVMTPQCNIPEGFDAAAAVPVDPEPASVARGLLDLFRLSDADRRAMGERGKALVARQFTWPTIAAQMCEVYEWTLGGGTPPACLWTD